MRGSFSEGETNVSWLLRTAYQLRYHEFAGWALDRWLATFALAAALLVWLFGRQSLGRPVWFLAGLLLLVGLAVLVLRRWAAARMYVVFRPQPTLPAPPGRPLDPTGKVSLHATGAFEVEGRQHFFADLLAYWRTFATREHAVMAIIHPSRYLLVGATPGQDLGMWYIFFQPAMRTAVTAGELAWGRQCRPALEVRYQLPSARKPPAWRRFLRRPAAEGRPRVVYLAFDDQPSLQQVWADLLAD